MYVDKYQNIKKSKLKNQNIEYDEIVVTDSQYPTKSKVRVLYSM
jgi:hypothetical protein